MTLSLNFGNNTFGLAGQSYGGNVSNALSNTANNVSNALSKPKGVFDTINALDKATKVNVSTPFGKTSISAVPGSITHGANAVNSLSKGKIGDAVVSGIKSYASLATFGLSDLALNAVDSVVGKETTSAVGKSISGAISSVAEGVAHAAGAIGDAIAGAAKSVGEALGISSPETTEVATETTTETTTETETSQTETSETDTTDTDTDNDNDSDSGKGDKGGDSDGGDSGD